MHLLVSLDDRGVSTETKKIGTLAITAYERCDANTRVGRVFRLAIFSPPPQAAGGVVHTLVQAVKGSRRR